jgi:hypothetical protein
LHRLISGAGKQHKFRPRRNLSFRKTVLKLKQQNKQIVTKQKPYIFVLGAGIKPF